jgi:trehalose 6-phosphate phosphatase
MMTQLAIDRAFELCLETLSRSPAGLFTDFDGTVSHVANSPDQAVLAENAGEALAKLADSLQLTAIVTGRSADDARRLVEVEGIQIIGNHGLERISEFGRVVRPEVQPQIDDIAQAMATIQQDLAGDPLVDGAVFENKGLSASIHYRLTQDRDRARDRILPLVEREANARGLHVTEGRLVVELRPTVAVNKGTAIAEIISEFQLSGAVYFGDDVTDLDAFAALKSLSSSDFSGTTVSVLSAESDPRMRETADVWVDGVEECVTLLTRLGDSLATRR